MNTVYIGIGSNLGNREKNIQDALTKMQTYLYIELVLLISSFYD